jgi:tetraacyldisaccharide 4'-kinase
MSGLERAWWSQREPWTVRAALALLWPAEALFRIGVAGRGLLYTRGWAASARAFYTRGWVGSASVAAPVISVGNLAVGGAGKTPVVLAIAERLRRQGRSPAILSRGYGAVRSDPRVVASRDQVFLDAEEGGDEPVLLARRLPGVPVLCGPDRAALARRALAELGVDALLLDDGFQHRALARDLDVVVIDASNPFGNGHLLPRGPNREPASALRRADLVWLTHADAAAPEALDLLRAKAQKATGRPAVESRHAVVGLLGAGLDRPLAAESLRGRRVLLLSALARPAGFRRTVGSLGAEVVAERTFRDHHRFTEGELEEALRAAAQAGCDRVVTTEKDAVRLPPAAAQDDRICVVRIEAEILAGEAMLQEELARALALPGGNSKRRRA